MEENLRFVTQAQTERFTLPELCDQFCISRKTAHKHLVRAIRRGQAARAFQIKL